MAEQTAKATAHRKPRNGAGGSRKASTEPAGRANPLKVALDRVKGLAVRSGRIRPTAALAIALALGFLVWLIFIRGDDSSGGKPQSAAPGVTSQAELVTAGNLIHAVAGAGYPVYWVGPEPGNRYEVTRPSQGRLLVRYLPQGESAGTKTTYLSVGSYTQQNAYKTLEKLVAKPGSNSFEVAHGGLAYVDRASPTSVYVAYPNVPTQIEVYDPHPGRAGTLVRSGIVTPIG
jgi:hypothetical protein